MEPVAAGCSGWREDASLSPRMYPLMLLLVLGSLCAQGVLSGTDTLQYFMTTVIGEKDIEPNFPQFFSAVYLNDVLLDWYDSLAQVLEPRAPWMKQAVGPDYWVNGTLLMWYQQNLSTYVLLSTLNQMNQTKGVHTYQVLQGCDVTDQSATFGFYRTAFDTADFLYIDTVTRNWTAEVPEAEPVVKARNADQNFTQMKLRLLESMCDNADYFASFANETLQRKDEPIVRLMQRRLPNGSMTLFCHANGFYPSHIEMKWLKNGAKTQAELEAEDILLNPDGTYQAMISLNIIFGTRGDYSCLVQHSSLEEDKVVHWERGPEPLPEMEKDASTTNQGLSIGGIIGVVLALVILVFAVTLGLVIWQKRRRAEAFGERFFNT